MELTTGILNFQLPSLLFMMSKIQNLNGTHNSINVSFGIPKVVYDVKDTKFEWNSQLIMTTQATQQVVYDVKDTKFEWNSQRG
mgnify:CR=1 FL=1